MYDEIIITFYKGNHEMMKVKRTPITLTNELQDIASGLLGVALGDANYLENTLQHSSARRVGVTVFTGSIIATLVVVLYQAIFQAVVGGNNLWSAQAIGTFVWHLTTQIVVMSIIIYVVSDTSYNQLKNISGGEGLSLSFIEHTQLLAVLIMVYSILAQVASFLANLFMVEQFGLASGAFVIFPVMGLIVGTIAYFWAWVWRGYRMFYGLSNRQLITVFLATFVSYTMLNLVYGWVVPLLASPITDHLMW